MRPVDKQASNFFLKGEKDYYPSDAKDFPPLVNSRERGTRIGYFTVLGQCGITGSSLVYLARCECKKDFKGTLEELKKKKCHICEREKKSDCLKNQKLPPLGTKLNKGMRIGSFTVLGTLLRTKKNNELLHVALCDCGKVVTENIENLDQIKCDNCCS